jgi:hypothetical protein
MSDENQIKRSLDKLTENLDQDTLNQLDAVRRKALATNRKAKWHKKIYWPMFGPAIAAMLMIVVFFVSDGGHPIEPRAELLFDDLDLLSYEIDSELLEDLEFIAWLEDENVLAGELL